VGEGGVGGEEWEGRGGSVGVFDLVWTGVEGLWFGIIGDDSWMKVGIDKALWT
jgi:hypothetical protein